MKTFKPDLIYRIRKEIHIILTKYAVKRNLMTTIPLLIYLTLIWVLGSLLMIVIESFFVDSHVEDKLGLFWVGIIALTSGFDVQANLHIASRIVLVLMLIFGIIYAAVITGKFTSIFADVTERSKYLLELPKNFNFRYPIIILGSNKKLINIIRHIRSSKENDYREIIIADNNVNNLEKIEGIDNENIFYAKGNPADEEFLKKIIKKGEKNSDHLIKDFRAVILADDLNDKFDAKALETALAIEAIEEDFYTLLEIKNKDNEYHLKQTKVDEWICPTQFAEYAIAQSSLQHNHSRVFESFIDSTSKEKKSNRMYIAGFGEYSSGQTKYSEVKKILRQKSEVVLIGFFIRFKDEEEFSRRMVNNNMKKFSDLYSLLKKNSNFLNNYFLQINPCSPKRLDKLFSSSKKNPFFVHSDFILEENDKIIYISDEKLNIRF